MADLPECWCAPLTGCDWTYELHAKYSHQGAGLGETLDYKLTGIAQPLAKAIMSIQIKVLNENGVDIYTRMLEACGGDENKAAAETVRALVDG